MGKGLAVNESRIDPARRGALSKREQKRLERRATIVESATRYFLDHGYAATSMSAIADELGGSKATLWSYFPTKEELFIAVVDAQVAIFADAIDDVVKAQGFSMEGLRRYCLSFLHALLTPSARALYRVILGDGDRFPELNAIFYVRGPTKALHQLTEFLGTELERDKAEQLSMLINTALWGWRSNVLTGARPLGPDEAEAFVDLVLKHLTIQ